MYTYNYKPIIQPAICFMYKSTQIHQLSHILRTFIGAATLYDRAYPHPQAYVQATPWSHQSGHAILELVFLFLKSLRGGWIQVCRLHEGLHVQVSRLLLPQLTLDPSV